MKLLHHPRHDGHFEFQSKWPYVQQVAHKPTGFWVSVAGEDSWEEWCRSNEFGVKYVDRSFSVELAEDANILMITSRPELVSFTKTFQVSWPWEREHRSPTRFPQFNPIDWQAVEQAYGGIIIAPYQWSSRMEPHWYYGWDCASGCIWDLSQIQSVTAMESDRTSQ